ncbi:MAG: hypothetical protein SWO11_23870 [Thermodesulfobacteriota bacterium]|nr:hypothetical protein [Thermodesulfobacteriota bacterium]
MEDTQDVSNNNKYDELDDIDRRLIELKLQTPSLTYCKLSEIVGVNRFVVSHRMKKNKVKQAINDFHKSALQILLDSQNEAALVLRQQLKSKDEKIAQGAAKEIIKGVLSDSVDIPKGLMIEFVNGHKKES